jgi:Uma2 family endonuclease
VAATTSVTEDRTVQSNVSWETYLEILRDHEWRSLPHFSYDHGTLETVSPMPIHEACKRHLDLAIAVYAEERDIDVYGLGSTTFQREDIERGFEADSCFYVQNQDRVRGKARLDLTTDPVPDVVIEIDITHSTLDKLSIYAEFGVPEVWRYNGTRLQFLLLRGDAYEAMQYSVSLPIASVHAFQSLLNSGLAISETAWMRRVRAWLRESTPQP